MAMVVIFAVAAATIATWFFLRRRLPRSQPAPSASPPSADELRAIGLSPPRSGPAMFVTGDGSAVVLLGGPVWPPRDEPPARLVTRLDPYAPSAWPSVKESSAGSLLHMHKLPTSSVTPLADGSLLLLGGRLAERYHPKSERSREAPLPVEPRSDHTATALADGRILILGGLREVPAADPIAPRAEIGDGEAAFREIGEMVQPRYLHRATLLEDGRVLVTGGLAGADRFLSDVEMFDPSTETFASVAPMKNARHSHTSTRLQDGRVLVVGGVDANDVIASAEIFDPTDGSWKHAPPLRDPRVEHAAVLLVDGGVLIIGAEKRSQACYGELFDPRANAWRAIFPSEPAPHCPACGVLPDGRVLIAFDRELHLFTPRGWDHRSAIEHTHGRAARA